MGTLSEAVRVSHRGSDRLRHVGKALAAGMFALTLAACASTPAPTSGNAPVDQKSLDEAKNAVKQYTDPAADFTGPKTGFPVGDKKSVVFVSCAATIALCNDAGAAVKDAAQTLGWNVNVIDGGGTATGWLDAMNKAIALHPDAIIEAAISPDAVPEPFKRAKEAGIPVVSLFASGSPGPIDTAGVFYNEDTDGAAVGTAMAQYAVADSGGRARVVIIYDNTYAIARAKNDAMKKVIEACSSCQLLEDVSTPFGELSKNVPGLLSGWLSKYSGEPLYVLSVGDIAFDTMIPTLNSRGVKAGEVKLIGADGSAAAYQRIRDGKFQVTTVPQPVREMAYNAVDQVTRALNSQPAVSWSPVPFLVTRDNVNDAGGDQNRYEPANGYADQYKKIWGIS